MHSTVALLVLCVVAVAVAVCPDGTLICDDMDEYVTISEEDLRNGVPVEKFVPPPDVKNIKLFPDRYLSAEGEGFTELPRSAVDGDAKSHCYDAPAVPLFDLEGASVAHEFNSFGSEDDWLERGWRWKAQPAPEEQETSHNHAHGADLEVIPFALMSERTSLEKSGKQTEEQLITLVASADVLGAIRFLPDLAAVWDGPISVSVACNQGSVLDELLNTYESSMAMRKHVDIHLVRDPQKFLGGMFGPLAQMSHVFEQPSIGGGFTAGRGIARVLSRTNWIFSSDMAVLPFASARVFANELLQVEGTADTLLHSAACPNLRVHIVPGVQVRNLKAFRRVFPDGISAEPGKTTAIPKTQLLSVFADGLVSTLAPESPHRYSPIDYVAWFSAEEPYVVDYTPFFSPMTIGPRSMPPERGHVRSCLAQVGHAQTLNAVGYNFIVWPTAYVLHRSMTPKMKSCSALDWHTFYRNQAELSRQFDRTPLILGTGDDFLHYCSTGFRESKKAGKSATKQFKAYLAQIKREMN